MNFRPAYSKQSLAVIGLFILACLYTIYFAKIILVPLTIAILLNFLLYPIIKSAKKIRIPESLSALIVVVSLFLLIVYAFYSLSGPVQNWLVKIPQNLTIINKKVEILFHPIEKPLEGLVNIQEQIQKTTETPTTESIQSVKIKQTNTSVFGLLLTTTGVFFIQLGFILFILYFLLSTGDFFVLKTVELLPLFSQKKEAVMVAREIRSDINRFLFIKTWTGLCLAVVIAIVFYFLKMPAPILWGMLACILEFIPYLGVTVGTLLVGITALIMFDNFSHFLAVPLSYFIISTMTGNFFVPLILSRGLLLHPVIVFVGVILGGWIWGVAGALIAVPMLSILK